MASDATSKDQLSLVKQLLSSCNYTEARSLFEKIPPTEDFRFIGKAIENRRFQDAVLLIEDYERQGSQVEAFYDPIISTLKIELLVVQQDLAELQAEHVDLLKMLDTFQIKYHNRVSQHLQKVLRLRKEKLRILAQMDLSFQEAYEEAQQAYEELSESIDAPVAALLYTLNPEDQVELKRLYRKASLLCHPDRVIEAQKERARGMFEELNEAYGQNNIKKVRLMAELLETVGYFDSMRENLNNPEALRRQIELDRIQMEEVEAERQEILASQAYRTVSSIDDWEVYFAELVENFKDQAATLERWHLMQANQN